MLPQHTISSCESGINLSFHFWCTEVTATGQQVFGAAFAGYDDKCRKIRNAVIFSADARFSLANSIESFGILPQLVQVSRKA